jgi:hypothetical protein
MITTTALPKSKYFIKNVIESFHIQGTTIEIEAFYDTLPKQRVLRTTLHKGNRFSCTVKSIRTQYPTGHYNRKSFKVCGGYGKHNQITHPTYESSAKHSLLKQSILLHALQMAELGNDIIRDFKLKLILNE